MMNTFTANSGAKMLVESINNLDGGIVINGVEVPIEAAAMRDTSRKLVFRATNDDLRILTRTTRGKLLQWTMRRGVFDDSASSVGGQSSFWRLLRLIELSQAYLFRIGVPDAVSGTWTTGQTSMYPGVSSGERYLVQSRRSTVQGSSATYNITVPASGRVGVVVGVTASSPTAVTVTCGAVSQVFEYREGNDGATGTAKMRVLELTGCTPGAGTVVVTLTTRETGQTFYLFGPLVADLSKDLPATIPASTALIATFDLADVIVGTASNGASDLAVHDEDLGKWVGSYHGGHASEAEIIDGATALSVGTAGDLAIATEPRIVQSGDLNAKLTINTEHRWSTPSELVLSGTIQGAINSKRAYIMMSTTRPDWTLIDGATVAETPSSSVIGRKSSIWQRRPDDGSRAVYIRAYESRVNGVPVVPYAEQWVQGSAYAKTRLGVLDTVTTQAVNRIDFTAALGIAHA